MSYTRYTNKKTLNKNEKIKLLEEYNEYYKQKLRTDGLNSLNIKIPRNVFENTLDRIGCILIEESAKLAKDKNVKEFLDNNPLPPHMKEFLPDDFRTFSLLLNAMKQWVSAESAATDRYLLGGTARETCRNAMIKCIVTDELLGMDAELHHPMRDGRPPILLSKNGHNQVERSNQNKMDPTKSDSNNKIWDRIIELKSERHMSWIQLREGCNAILTGSANYRAGAKSFANTVIRETGLNPREILTLLDSLKL